MVCLICGHVEEDLKSFAFHAGGHGLSSREYTFRHVLGLSAPPKCGSPGCIEPVRYSSFRFKRYCRSHSSLAESAGGKIGGRIKLTWNKGSTAADDPRIPVLVGPDNHFFRRKHTDETKRMISASKRVSSEELLKRIASSHGLELVTDPGEYLSRQHQHLQVRCATCGSESQKTLQAIERGSRCYRCYPISTSTSEIEIADVIESWGSPVRRNCRDVIAPLELDVYVPDHQVAVEFNGLYWHSREDHDPRAHLKKTIACLERGIQLVHVFSDEWRDKREICESLFRHRLGISREFIYARSCDVVDLDPLHAARDFFERSHLAGHARADVAFGLVDRLGILAAAISLRRPFHRASYGPGTMEIARFATRPGTAVVGGLGRLVSRAQRWAMGGGYDRIMTYVDRRIGEGRGYLAAGFRFERDTAPGYWYTDGVRRFDRFSFRAKDGMSEREVAAAAKVDRIYGCGNKLLFLDI